MSVKRIGVSYIVVVVPLALRALPYPGAPDLRDLQSRRRCPICQGSSRGHDVRLRPTPTGTTGGCTASLTTINSWAGGFQASVTVTNASSSLVNGWTTAWTFPAGETIGSLCSGTATQSGQP
ncbi:MAG: hypothetical protein HHJ10_13905 [Cellulomonas sp.]|uniref:cellulose binding domain-containing protein n=1 Tax=Cellulomonas sp. TaxID=40001 RepID=UPI0017E7FD95|nr:hypothetical protein [Cellulomonas sp.]